MVADQASAAIPSAPAEMIEHRRMNRRSSLPTTGSRQSASARDPAQTPATTATSNARTARKNAICVGTVALVGEVEWVWVVPAIRNPASTRDSGREGDDRHASRRTRSRLPR